MNNSKIKNWYEAMRDQVENSQGAYFLNDPFSTSKNTAKSQSALNGNQPKSKKRFILF